MQKELRYIISLGVAVLMLSGCAQRENAQEARPALRVKTMVITPQADTNVSRYVGTVQPAGETPLSMQTTGRITQIAVRNGDAVHEGQVLLRVDSTQAIHALQTAEAAWKQAQDGLERVKKVHDKGAVTDQKMVEVESQWTRAKSLYAAAQQQVRECTLTAPCDGVVSGLDSEIGQTVIPGMPLCSLLDVSHFCIRFTVPETEVRMLSGRGEVTCAAIDAVYPITITEKSLTANMLTHTYEVKARIHGGEGLLRAGMIGKVVMGTQASEANTQPAAIVVPARCILLRQDGPTVWVVEQGRAARRTVTTDGYQADGVRVIGGLQTGDTLITEGYQKLYNNCKVSVERE